MMNLKKAYDLTLEYFKREYDINEISNASEDDEYWYFRAGKKDVAMIGTIIASVDKKDGKIEQIDYLKKSNQMRIVKSKPVDLMNL